LQFRQFYFFTYIRQKVWQFFELLFHPKKTSLFKSLQQLVIISCELNFEFLGRKSEYQPTKVFARQKWKWYSGIWDGHCVFHTQKWKQNFVMECHIVPISLFHMFCRQFLLGVPTKSWKLLSHSDPDTNA
jgi:hypothetical protein